MVTRIGVDVGGTFSDLVCFSRSSGLTIEGKVPTEASAPELGVLDAVRKFVPPAVLADAAYFLHGTTVGLNALIERRGATVGLLCTEGLRDVLEIRRGDRAEMYNPFWQAPEPLVPRHLRLGIAERIRADGSVHKALEPDSVAAALDHFARHQVDSIAVCLMNAYANPDHEVRVRELIGRSRFEGSVSVSHAVSGEYREYERTSTTVIDAFVRHRMADYLRRLQAGLEAMGFSGLCLITRSGGGAMTFQEAEERPFETIMSGPAAGAAGAAELSRGLGLEALITADVGGTSFDTTMVLNGRPTTLFEGEVDGMPLQTPWIDVRSIGSGGGSIAAVDGGGLMQVGPLSAGARPGPAAYGHGGIEPTLTDAAVHLGMLGPGRLAAGITLDFEQANTALSRVAGRIGRPVTEAAVGIMRIAASKMGSAMREITVESGIDPRGMTLLPFGGAGPLMACLLADELAMSRIVVPAIAGNFSAWGLLGTDLVQSAARTAIMPLDAHGLAAASTLVADLIGELDARGNRHHKRAQHEGRLDLRFQGQEHWLSIPVPLEGTGFGEGVEAVAERFRAEYLKSFGGTIELPVEIVSVRATRTVALPRPQRIRQDRMSRAERDPPRTWRTFSFSEGSELDFSVLDREELQSAFDGPLIVTESTTTLYVDAGWTGDVGERGELTLSRIGSRDG